MLRISTYSLIPLLLLPLQALAQSGCCSHHGGVSFCGSSGFFACMDGSQSPTCTCSYVPPTPPPPPKPKTHKITISSSSGGTTTPSGKKTVADGYNLSIETHPSEGYFISSMKVDKTPIDPVSPYTFSDITADHSFQVVYTKHTFTVTTEATAGGTVTKTKSVKWGDSFTVSAAPAKGFALSAFYVDGAPVALTGAKTFKYQLKKISSNHVIRAEFAPPVKKLPQQVEETADPKAAEERCIACHDLPLTQKEHQP